MTICVAIAPWVQEIVNWAKALRVWNVECGISVQDKDIWLQYCLCVVLQHVDLSLFALINCETSVINSIVLCDVRCRDAVRGKSAITERWAIDSCTNMKQKNKKHNTRYTKNISVVSRHKCCACA